MKETQVPEEDMTPTTQLTDVEKFLTTVAGSIDQDPAAVQAAIVAGILASKTAEDVLHQQETTHAEDVIGVRLLITGLRWLRSDFEQGPGFYCVIDCTDDDGTRQVVTVGSANVMAQLFRLDELGHLPFYAAIVRATRPTAAGYYPMRLEGREAP